ncbi:hypothetical protein DFH94DRAFT_683263 [Russula ochroleuca]|uniref:Uncharacterized protein n=1 Tax=Russula ochroleuca TaxID=152965 RepID=A0A9P5T7M9_9AGAM|nr:hypothetical protein DFH94DRAFT_683263 [Russula ochroleuca]
MAEGLQVLHVGERKYQRGPDGEVAPVQWPAKGSSTPGRLKKINAFAYVSTVPMRADPGAEPHVLRTLSMWAWVSWHPVCMSKGMALRHPACRKRGHGSQGILGGRECRGILGGRGCQGVHERGHGIAASCMRVEGVGVGVEASSTAHLSSPENVAVVVLCVCRGCTSRVESVCEASGMHVHMSVMGWLSSVGMDEGEGVGEKAPSVSCLRTVTRYHSTRTLCLALGAREGVVLRRGGGHLVFGARVSSVGEESKVTDIGEAYTTVLDKVNETAGGGAE